MRIDFNLFLFFLRFDVFPLRNNVRFFFYLQSQCRDFYFQPTLYHAILISTNTTRVYEVYTAVGHNKKKIESRRDDTWARCRLWLYVNNIRIVRYDIYNIITSRYSLCDAGSVLDFLLTPTIFTLIRNSARIFHLFMYYYLKYWLKIAKITMSR